MVTQVVLDRNGRTDDFATNYGMSVGNLIAKLAEQDKIEAALEEARQAREAAVRAIKIDRARVGDLAQRRRFGWRTQSKSKFT